MEFLKHVHKRDFIAALFIIVPKLGTKDEIAGSQVTKFSVIVALVSNGD